MLLFGRMKHRVVLDEVYLDHSTLKWIAPLASMAGIAAVLIGIEGILGNLIFVAVMVASFGGLSLFNRRLFP